MVLICYVSFVILLCPVNVRAFPTENYGTVDDELPEKSPPAKATTPPDVDTKVTAPPMEETAPLDFKAEITTTRVAKTSPPDIDAKVKTPPIEEQQTDTCEVEKMMNGFTFDLQRHLNDNKDDNFVFSPYGIYLSLALLSLGARQNTKKQIDNALKWKDGTNYLEKLKLINAELISQDENIDNALYVANNGWISPDTVPLTNFLDESYRYFGVKYQQIDFANPIIARDHINQWVSNHTGERIPELFPPKSIDVLTKLVLANAIYFKGQWKTPFMKKHTMPGSFARSDGEVSSGVEYMFQKGRFKTGDHRNVELLELPYGEDGEFSMLFARPQNPSDVWRYKDDPKNFIDIGSLSEEINADLMNEWFKNMKENGLDILIPKFRLKQEIDLSKKLKLLGITDVFTTRADLSGIADEKNLFLSSAVHKSYIEVDEKGTKAVAATGLRISFYSAPPVIKMNSPFLFFIINKRCNSVIFAGKVMDPLS